MTKTIACTERIEAPCPECGKTLTFKARIRGKEFWTQNAIVCQHCDMCFLPTRFPAFMAAVAARIAGVDPKVVNVNVMPPDGAVGEMTEEERGEMNSIAANLEHGREQDRGRMIDMGLCPCCGDPLAEEDEDADLCAKCSEEEESRA